MMGIGIDELQFVFGDNQSVLANKSLPNLNLKNKYSSIAFHFDREGVARVVANIPKQEFKSVRYADKVITWKGEMIKIYLVYAPLHR